MSQKDDNENDDGIIRLSVGDCAIVFRPGANPTIYVSEPETFDEHMLEVQYELAFIVYALNNPLFREMFDKSQESDLDAAN